jgi:uncharacterized integral membrane protein
MRIFRFFIGFVVLCIFTIFAAANTHIVPLHFFITKTPTVPTDSFALPAFILIYFCFGIGFIAAWVLSLGIKRGYKKSVKTLKKQVAQQEAELKKLRNLPLANPEPEVEPQPGSIQEKPVP